MSVTVTVGLGPPILVVRPPQHHGDRATTARPLQRGARTRPAGPRPRRERRTAGPNGVQHPRCACLRTTNGTTPIISKPTAVTDPTSDNTHQGGLRSVLPSASSESEADPVCSSTRPTREGPALDTARSAGSVSRRRCARSGSPPEHPVELSPPNLRPRRRSPVPLLALSATTSPLGPCLVGHAGRRRGTRGSRGRGRSGRGSFAR